MPIQSSPIPELNCLIWLAPSTTCQDCKRPLAVHPLKGQCHQIRMALKWGSLKGLNCIPGQVGHVTHHILTA
jgi:hypothetical protein